MKTYILTLREVTVKCMGYVHVNIYKPFDKEFTKDDIPEVIEYCIDYSIGVIDERER